MPYNGDYFNQTYSVAFCRGRSLNILASTLFTTLSRCDLIAVGTLFAKMAL